MRLALRTAVGILVLAAGLTAVVYAYLRRSLPEATGTFTVAGLSAPIDIVRDQDDVPHIFAASKRDGLFGLGYVHAQDRLWQMELQRRIGHGQLSEVLGEAALPQDRFLRTVGFGRAARSAWAAMPDWARLQTEAYVAGINAFIATHHGSQLPPEFSLLRFEPAPWNGPDVVVWVKMMAWDLSGNYALELLRHDLTMKVGAEQMARLMPPYPRDGLSILGDLATRALTASAGTNPAPAVRLARFPIGCSAGLQACRHGAPEDPQYIEMENALIANGPQDIDSRTSSTASYAAAFDRALISGDPAVGDVLRRSASEGLGSNNWVVDGTMTASGRPLLANDPHLGARMPSTWYLAHVAAGDFEVIGATLPGTPAVALGRNRFIAWGATNVGADVQDLYRERIDPSGTTAEFRGVQEPMRIIPETILVKGAAPVVVNVRVTRHGPLVSDAINYINATSATTPRLPPVDPLALRWTALDSDDQTLPSYLELNEAHDWQQFTRALRSYVTPSQNFVYADVNGHIGYYLPGRIPIRASGDGAMPVDGWAGAAEWTGWVPFDELPHTFDPPEHFIVTANHRPAPATYPHLIGIDWVEPFRAQRIVDCLEGRTRLTPDEFAKIQADTRSALAERLLPRLLAHAHPDNPADQAAVALLRGWDLNADGNRSAAAIFEAWYFHLGPTLVGGALGPQLTESYASRFSHITRFFVDTLTTNDNSWCDAPSTPAHETCDDAVTRALREAVSDLEQRLGSDMTRWRWDRLHDAVFLHQLAVVAPLRALLNRSMPNGGDWSTVNVGTSSAEHPYEQRTVPGYREIIDLSPANDSRFSGDLGQSGHFLSPHYDDFLADWHAVRQRKMRIDRREIENGALGRIRLTPRNAG